jgi:UDP-N-acetylglucosamine 2-epimerase (non-hydrolysing)
MLYLVAGARPNFIKLAPLARALAGVNFEIVHTGQHYDEAMSESFFRLLDIPAPQVNLEVGSGTQGEQTARILERFERFLLEGGAAARPAPQSDWVVVFGDVNSTLACTLAAVKLGVNVAHVEAGLRSFDRSMPEEINRLVTDALADLLFVSEPAGLVNLGGEGIPAEKIHFVGNIMIDSLAAMLSQAETRRSYEGFGVQPGGYALLTLHRPSNVDDPVALRRLMELFVDVSAELPVIFPAHPRTRRRLEENGLLTAVQAAAGLRLTGPLDYLDALCLEKHARLVCTDSGGMQEETTFLGVPCLTLRENTERPITVTHGTSTLVGSDPDRIRRAWRQALDDSPRSLQPIPLWDGQAAGRIAAVLAAAGLGR